MLLGLHMVSTWSPHGLHSVGMMLTAASTSLSVSEVSCGTGLGFHSSIQYRGSSLEFNSVSEVGVSDLRYAARAQIDHIFKVDT
jgi:hypothetical protein